MSPVRVVHHDSVALLVVDAPPVNALGHAVRQGLLAAIEQVDADPAVRSVVILCRGKTFFAGADITEFDKPQVAPDLPVLVDRIEACAKPVVAAMHGTAFGGGLELALACHYRVALETARLGLPEVKLGLIPGAGGTQRLPRIVGVQMALDMIVSGEPVGAGTAHAAGLVDRLCVDALEEAAIAFALEVADGRPLPRSSQRTDRIDSAATAARQADAYRAQHARKLRDREAPLAAIEAVVMAASGSFAAGIEHERELFQRLLNSDQARAQQYLFFAERRAAKIDDLPADTVPLDVVRVGLVGAGTMGTGIAINFLNIGLPVTIVETSTAALDRGQTLISAVYARDVEKGRITAAEQAARLAALHPTMEFADLADCDLVIEAVFEEMALKQDIFRQLSATCKASAILASNSSGLNIDMLAAQTSRPGQVLGMHFFSPAHIMKLVEVVRGAATTAAVLQTAMTMARRIGKIPVVAGVCDGFIGNRMVARMLEQANRLILEGATPDQVDQAHMAFGMPMGPFRTGDLAGLDIGWHRDASRADTIVEALCAAGRWGQKTGRGFYDYDAQRNPTPSLEAAEIIERFRARANITPRAISEDEIIVRCFYPVINEGAKILEEGFAQRGSDIDVVWINGYGWPRHKGGPMFWADLQGLSSIIEKLEACRHDMGEDFSISPLLRRIAEDGSKISKFSYKS